MAAKVNYGKNCYKLWKNWTKTDVTTLILYFQGVKTSLLQPFLCEISKSTMWSRRRTIYFFINKRSTIWTPTTLYSKNYFAFRV